MMNRFFCVCLLASFGFWAPTLHAATFNVTSGSCTGSGSIVEAINSANNTAGSDTIVFDQDLIININSGSSCGLFTNDPSEFYIATVTEDVIFEGNNASIVGNPLWVTADGRSNIVDACPSRIPGTTIIREVPGFLRIADGVSVEVREMKFSKLSALVDVRKGSSLTLKDSRVVEIIDWFESCGRHPINVTNIDGNVSLYNSEITQSHAVSIDTYVGNDIILWNGAAISSLGEGGTLNVVESIFDGVLASIQWKGTANIVSSRFVDSGWINIIGGTLNIVNSAFNGGLATNSDYLEIYASTGDSTANIDVNIWASTFYAPVYDCHSNAGCLRGDVLGAFIAKGNANGHVTFNVKESAIGAGIPDFNPDNIINIDGSSNIIADALTWMQPVDGQDAAALRAITGQPGLLTDPPGLPLDPFAIWPSSTTPLLGTPATPGVLIDGVPDAAPGETNALLSPVDGSDIVIDALGNPRVDANGRRNIGAVQLTLAPHLTVASVASTSVELSWNRPKDPPPPAVAITGYEVCYGQGAKPDPAVIGTACEDGNGNPGTVKPISGDPSITLGKVTGLSHSTTYWFLVRGVNPDPGPWSNVVIATLGDDDCTFYVIPIKNRTVWAKDMDAVVFCL